MKLLNRKERKTESVITEVDVEDVVVKFYLTNMRDNELPFNGWATIYKLTGEVIKGSGTECALGFIERWKENGFSLLGDEVIRWEDFKSAEIVSKSMRMHTIKG